MQEKLKYENFEHLRLDSYLAKNYKDYSRAYFQKLIEQKKIFVNEMPEASSYKLKRGDCITFEFKSEKASAILPENINIEIIYEDDDIIAINKHPAIVVHPSYGHLTGTLLNALAAYFKGKSQVYLVHRLDKDTSGIILFAKNEKSKISLSKQFQKRAVRKIYCAAVKGIVVESRGRIEAPIGRSPQNRKIMTVNPLAKKMAVTEFKVLARKDGFSLLEIRIITGRTHQIRSHMKYINHPVVGDNQYGGPQTINGQNYNRQMLHSREIAFTHPKTSKNVHLIADFPDDMRDIFKLVRYTK
ncbi:MAG: RluA family pseudouridine synthase [Elusimicrobiota bacterium]|jgi:23S rRNA pseudouridine1911/1915/1917 synthase|nr:RluA family pseudouridine synthase [Elusimicrobiota bacterium]